MDMLDVSLKEKLTKLLWAKSRPFKPLWVHMLETGIVAQILMMKGCFVPLRKELEQRMHLSAEQICSLVGYLAAMHDIGKIHPSFVGSGAVLEAKAFLEKHHLEFCDDHFRHEQYGAARVKQIWKHKERFPRHVRRYFSALIRLHHQGKRGNAGAMDKSRAAIWEDMQNDYEEMFWKFFEPPTTVSLQHIDAVNILLLGIIITADWIASGKNFDYPCEMTDIKQVAVNAEKVGIDFLRKNNMTWIEPLCIHKFTELWPDIPRAGMRVLQQQVETIFEDPNEKPLAMILEAPMGEGKTEAAMYAASQLAQRWNKKGFYIGLPTAATSNQMYNRINAMLAQHQLGESRLLHAMAWQMDEDTDAGFAEEKIAEQWTAPLRRGLIAPYAVGTVDQVMMAALRVKYGVLRLAGLAEKVLIIDECHAYDSYMSGILIRLLEWCKTLHIPVVMLSATLPSEKKADFASAYDETKQLGKGTYPSITLLYEDKPLRQIAVRSSYQHSTVTLETVPLLGKEKKIAHIAQEFLQHYGGCLCILLNTVKEAQSVWSELRTLLPNEPIILFHARFDARRRKELEEQCIRLFGPDKSCRPKRAILVATQVVEQSLDLDFDAMITAICPIDLLFQRAGRIWRHKNTQRPRGLVNPKLTVLVPADKDKNYGPSGFVYANVILERTQEVLMRKAKLEMPKEIPELVEHVYSNGQVLEEQLQEWYEHQFEEELKQSSAEAVELPKPNPYEFCFSSDDPIFSDEDSEFMSAHTRLGEPSVRLALLPKDLWCQVVHVEHPSRTIAKEVLQFSFSVREKSVQQYLTSTCVGGLKPVQGDGLLTGVWLLPAEGGRCTFTNGATLQMDPLLGFLIKEGDE